MRPWLAEYVQRDITDKELIAMAWMIGFWLGDGHRSGAVFSLNSTDADLNQFLKEQAELWGMTYRYVKQIEPVGNLCANAYLHTYTNGIRNLNKANPLVDTLKGLKFYAAGVIKRPKNFPDFVQTEEIIVREALLAGLLDADGSTSIYRSQISMRIATVYPPLRDGAMLAARSLGLNVSVSHAAAKSFETYNAQEVWNLFITPGSNIERFFGIIDRCGLERRRDMPVYPKKKTDA
ncbi:hypothetical protein HG535_0A02010 [Zygotorulaspora mrakii]|uniref:DOD-type homing endonuclease domain-containing protein n=1 Tax=Zygotorulaspora mrakii TaxID=42260 RepID=A0A7H9AVR4_ZYGMR|nr:uncharacterized protein HG535_0A02010 [Zygotorulaspora mrakii]QLG70263.1 hypothetical protein HG535_0A02010 [Zygotorulaspora mrakii]